MITYGVCGVAAGGVVLPVIIVLVRQSNWELTVAEQTLNARTITQIRRDDLRVISLVGFAHLISHFYHLILAPLFPWLREEFGFSFAEMGFLMTVLFAVSGAMQALAGFVVDRYGAGKTLLVGLTCLTAAALVLGFSETYFGLMIGAVLAGLGNSVFHPVDYSMLNDKVSTARLGPAYSVHGLSGSLGWAFAPVFMVGIAVPFGWRAALISAAVLPVLVIIVFLGNRDVLSAGSPITDKQDNADEGQLDFLRKPEIWWCFTFFVFVSAALGASQNFAPTVFSNLFELTVSDAALSVTVMMLASALGMGVGGWLVHRSTRLDRNITVALLLGVIGSVLIGIGTLPAATAMILIGVMGFGIGLSGPSRDMLIRTVTPAGATGRVYGVVYSGLDVGIGIAPVVFGALLDWGLNGAVFYGVAVCLLLAVATVYRVSR